MSIPLENVTLSCFYQQGQNSGIEESETAIYYKELWKGSYSSAKNLLNSVSYGSSINAVHTALGFNRVSYYTAPSCPSRNGQSGKWILDQIRVEEQTAGTNSLVYLTFIGDYTAYSGLADDPRSDVWSVDWQSYSVSPYNFLKNEDHSDREITDESQLADIDWDSYGKRSHIQKYLDSQSSQSNANFCYIPQNNDIPTDYMLQLNGAEQEVAKKVALNRNATYHYPLVTHTSAKKGMLSASVAYPLTLGSGLDIETNLPSACPYRFDSVWKWIKIGDSMTQTKTESVVRFERRETWMGATEFDRNFYGLSAFTHDEDGIKNGRWKLEGL